MPTDGAITIFQVITLRHEQQFIRTRPDLPDQSFARNDNHFKRVTMSPIELTPSLVPETESTKSKKTLTHKEKKELKKKQKMQAELDKITKKGGEGHSELGDNFTVAQVRQTYLNRVI